MADCAARCVREAAGLVAYNTPLVEDEEWVCRSARVPDDLNKGNLKASFVTTREFVKGQLSGWRIGDPEELPALAEKLRGKEWRVDNLLAAKAGALRAARTNDDPRRVLCVINDTRIDEAGNHDDQHVAMSPCARLLEAQADLEVEMSDLKAQLTLIFKSSKVSLAPIQN